MQTELSAEADVLRAGYRVGYFSNRDIELWADRQIEASDAPSDQLLDLCVLRDTHPIDVMNLLRAVGTPDAETSIRNELGFIGHLFAANRLPLEPAIRWLYSLRDEPGVTDEQLGQIYYLDDGFDLAVAGYRSTLEDINQELMEFVTPYAHQFVKRYGNVLKLPEGSE